MTQIIWRTLLASLFVSGQVVYVNMAIAQCPEQWVKHISAVPSGGLSGPKPGIAIDHSGNIIYCGRVSPLVDSIEIDGVSMDFPGVPSTTDFGLIVLKLSASGSLIWSKPISGIKQNEPLDLVLDSIGHIYVGGRITGSLTVDNTVINGPDNSGSGYFLLKFNAFGDLLWQKSTTIRGSRCYDLEWLDGYGLICAFPFDGSIEIGGVTYTSDTPDYQDILFVRIDADGEAVTYINKIGGAGNVQMYTMDCDATGCIVQGRYYEEMQIDQFTLNTPSNTQPYLFQLSMNLDGRIGWVNHSTNLAYSEVHFRGLGIDENRVVFHGQSAFSWIEYGGVTLTEVTDPDHNWSRLFVGSVNRSDGNLNWFKAIDGGGAGGNPGNVIHSNSGTWVCNVHFDSTLTYEGLTIANSNSSIIRLDSDGNPECGIGIGGSIGSILRSADGYIVANLEFESNSTIEVFGQTLTSNGGLFDVAIAKTCLPCDTLASITEATTTQPALHIYPNPASQSVRVQVSGNGLQPRGIKVTDMLGRSVLSLPFAEVGGALDISALAPGLYTVAVQLQGGQVLRERLVVQR